MDISTNIIDLECLVNPCYTIKIPEQKINKIYSVNSEELRIYKRKIFQLTKEMLLGKRINNKINDAFHNFSRICIEHFKFIDKKDIIQNDYKDLQERTKKRDKGKFNLEKINKKMFKPEKKYNDIAAFLKIKTAPKQIFLPKKRNFKKKQVKDFDDKNLINKYEKKKKKNKKTKGEKKKKKNCVKVEI